MKTRIRKHVGALLFVVSFLLLSCAYTPQKQTKLGEAEAHYLLGGLYLKKSQYDQAISEFTRALEINPTYAVVYKGRGGAYLAKGE